MSNLPAVRAAHLPAVTDEGFLDEVRTQIAPKATDSELKYFAQVVAKTQLDPWSRQVYLIPRWDGRVKREVHRPQVSIDGLRLVAERSGKYEGQTPVEWCGDDGQWRDTWFESSAPRASRVGVYKTGRPHPTYAVAHYDEYVVTDRSGKPSGLWKDKPRVMIAKCAEALALRKAFPQETSGLYTSEEMGRADAPQAPQEPVSRYGEIPPLDSPEHDPAPVTDAEVVPAGDETVNAQTLKQLRATYDASGHTDNELCWFLLSVGVESLPEDPSKQDIAKAMRSLTVDQALRLEALMQGEDDSVPGSGEAA